MDSLIGKELRFRGTTFLVKKEVRYPADSILKRFSWLTALKPGYLVAVPYRGYFLTNITFEDEVMMVTEAEINGRLIKGPGRISQALGIKTETLEKVEIIDS